MSTGYNSPITTTISSPTDQQQQQQQQQQQPKQQQQLAESNNQQTTTSPSDEKQQHSPPSSSSSSSATANPTSVAGPQPPPSSSSSSSSAQPTAPKKITILLKAAGNAPILKMKNWEMEESKTVAYLVLCLRKILHLTADQSLFVFVNQSFSPTPDHTIGTLHQCFGGGGGAKLTIHYSTTLAWG